MPLTQNSSSGIVPGGLAKEVVRAANLIEAVIRETVELTRQGRRLVGLCPFHDDHRPSLHVDPVKQRAHCSICDFHVDVFGWVERRDNVDFKTAFALLAATNGNSEAATRRVSRTARAAPRRDDVELPPKLSDEAAMQRLRDERRLDAKTIEQFGIEPDYGRQAWAYPVRDGHRFKAYAGDQAPRKYWHETGTPNCLYGLDEAGRGGDTLLLVGGEPIVWQCWQAAIPAVSGIYGEGKVPERAAAEIEAEGFKRVVVVPDRDDAGKTGAKKSAAALSGGGLDVSIADLSVFDWLKGKKADLGDVFTQMPHPHGFRMAVERLIANAKPVTEVAQVAQSLGVEQVEQLDLKTRVMWARDLATAEVESPEPLWDGFLYPSSVQLLSSVAGLGKTTLLYSLLSAAAQDRAFVGRPFSRPLRALYLDLETPQSLRKEKLLNIWRGRVPEGLAFLDPIRLPDEADALRQVVTNNGFDVVVVDTVSDAFLTQNEDDNAEATRQMHVLRSLAHRTGCCVIAIHHMGKGERRDTYASRGASARPAHADVVINLDGDDHEILMKVVKNRWAEKSSLRLIKAGNDRFALGDPVPDSYPTALAEAVAVVEEVMPSGDISTGELKKLVMNRGVPDSTARKAIDKARERGLIEKPRYGFYRRADEPGVTDDAAA